MRSLVWQVSIYKLEVFCLVAELNSVSRAAERLGIAQPVVSSHLKSLAEKLEAQLMHRQGRRLVLTEVGERVHRWAGEVVSHTRELERELSDRQRGVRGTATVGASMTLGSYVLPAMIAGFHRAYPKGHVSVRVTTPKLATDAVHSGECDFAFTILAPRHETAGLDLEQVAEEPLILVAGPKMGIATGGVSLSEVADLPFVSAQANTPRREIEEFLLSGYGVRRRRIEMEFGHAEALKQAVRADEVVSFLFRASVEDELASGALREIQTQGMALAVPVYQVKRRGKTLSHFQASLMRHLASDLRRVSAPAAPQEPKRSARTIAGE